HTLARSTAPCAQVAPTPRWDQRSSLSVPSRCRRARCGAKASWYIAGGPSPPRRPWHRPGHRQAAGQLVWQRLIGRQRQGADSIPGWATPAVKAAWADREELVGQSKTPNGSLNQTAALTTPRYCPVRSAKSLVIQAALSPPCSALAVSATIIGLP